jgi:4-hydroxybenzoate polyprenyltransferase
VGAVLKDARNRYGDSEMECRTMAIVWGERKTKIFLSALIAIIFFGVLLFGIRFPADANHLMLKYMIFLLLIPLAVLAYLTIKADCENKFSQALFLTKIIIFTGALCSFVFTFLMAQKFDFPIFGLFHI